MTTTTSQDREFIASVISGSLLEESVEWIAKNMDIEEAFPDEVMTYARNWTIKYAANYFGPGDVFTDKELADWAHDNGFVKG